MVQWFREEAIVMCFSPMCDPLLGPICFYELRGASHNNNLWHTISIVAIPRYGLFVCRSVWLEWVRRVGCVRLIWLSNHPQNGQITYFHYHDVTVSPYPPFQISYTYYLQLYVENADYKTFKIVNFESEEYINTGNIGSWGGFLFWLEGNIYKRKIENSLKIQNFIHIYRFWIKFPLHH